MIAARNKFLAEKRRVLPEAVEVVNIEHEYVSDEAEVMEQEIINDVVNHPAHYTDGGIETIDFIEAKKLSYNLGSVVKYVSRAGKKEVDKTIEDLEKARWYIDREIKRLEAE